MSPRKLEYEHELNLQQEIPANENGLLLKLAALYEKNLAEDFIIPLLNELNFQNIEYKCGSGEKGADIVCTKMEKTFFERIYAIQIKKTKFTADSSSTTHLNQICTQLSQCSQEMIFFKHRKMQQPHEVWFISPFKLDSAVLEKNICTYESTLQNKITIIDGPRLLLMLKTYCPDTLTKLGDSLTNYLTNFNEKIHKIPEAIVLGMPKNYSILPNFVTVTLQVVFKDIGYLGNAKCFEKYPVNNLEKVPIKFRSIQDLTKIQNYFKALGCENCLELDGKSTGLLYFYNLITHIQKTIKLFQNRFKSKNSPEDISTNARDLFDLYKFYQTLIYLKNDTFFLKLTDNLKIDRTVTTFLFNPDCVSNLSILLKSHLNIQIIGAAGSGKTTLLKMLGITELKQPSHRIPIFCPLSNIATEISMEHFILSNLDELGYKCKDKQLVEFLQTGRCLILFDGIDEIISRIPDIQDKIITFITKYPKTQIVITSRDWAALDYNNLLSMSILPFDKNMIDLFIVNWFINDLNGCNRAKEHLKENPQMYEELSAPLFCAVFVALVANNAQLPTHEIDLLEGRLKLLLGDWDNAKGVRRNKFNIRDKQVLLQKFAWQLHMNHVRRMGTSELLNLIQTNLGNARSPQLAKSFLKELVEHNQLIFQEPNNTWSLGHLRYQEYLAAQELKERKVDNFNELLNDNWWHAVLKIYATNTRDISDILRDFFKGNTNKENYLFLTNLYGLAPNTDTLLSDQFFHCTKKYHSQKKDPNDFKNSQI